MVGRVKNLTMTSQSGSITSHCVLYMDVTTDSNWCDVFNRKWLIYLYACILLWTCYYRRSQFYECILSDKKCVEETNVGNSTRAGIGCTHYLPTTCIELISVLRISGHYSRIRNETIAVTVGPSSPRSSYEYILKNVRVFGTRGTWSFFFLLSKMKLLSH